MSINGQGHSLTLVKGHSDFKVKCLNLGLYTQVSDSGPLGPLVLWWGGGGGRGVFFYKLTRNPNLTKKIFFSFFFFFFFFDGGGG